MAVQLSTTGAYSLAGLQKGKLLYTKQRVQRKREAERKGEEREKDREREKESELEKENN